MIAALIIGATVAVAVYALANHLLDRRRRSRWPASTVAQLRNERKRRRLNPDDTTNNRWSSHR